MVYRVVSTKLTEEEHTKLLDACNTEGCTPSSLIKDAIMKRLENEKKSVEKPEEKITEKPCHLMTSTYFTSPWRQVQTTIK